jgi:tetratricopeptide (TPR) repeat protein
MTPTTPATPTKRTDTARLKDEQYLERLTAAINLRRQGYYPEALKVARDLVKMRPEESSVWHTLGQIATSTGDWQAALDCFANALRLLVEHGTVSTHANQYQATALGYAQSLMRFGRFGEAMQCWEAGRLNVSWSPWPATKYWDGERLNEEDYAGCIPTSLLVQCEGGYGDVFMFMRWLPLLKSRSGIDRVGLMIFAPLADFCDWSALGVDEVYKVGLDKIPFGRWEYSCSIMSMPAVFGAQEWGDIPDGLIQTTWPGWAFTKRDRTGPFRLGFCWRAEENSSPIRTKSLPVETASHVTALLEARFDPREYTDPLADRALEIYSLSPERKDLYNTDSFEHPDGVALEFEHMREWRDTARYLCSMDFVLTVDTAVAHLCGLLGVPALVLVPAGGCWRWHDSTTGMLDQSKWYGPQLRLYRQPTVLEWDAEDIVKALLYEIERNNTADVANA